MTDSNCCPEYKFKSFNKYIATKPMQRQEAKVAKVIAGMEVISDKFSLVPLTVVFDADGFKAGDTIYVDGNSAGNHPWSKNVFEMEGVNFILVPDNFVMVAKVQEPAAPLMDRYSWGNLNLTDSITLCTDKTR